MEDIFELYRQANYSCVVKIDSSTVEYILFENSGLETAVIR
jgi:hypothetical protein